MKNFPISPISAAKGIWLNYHLIKNLIYRDIAGRYQGSLMGMLWSFLNPLFMLLVYTFVFSEIFKARWGSGDQSKAEFALVLFAGLIIFNIFSESINRAPQLIISNTNYVKKVIFPIEILPVVVIGVSLFQAIVSFIVWLVVHVIFKGGLPATIWLAPFVLIPMALLTSGLSWFLASLGVYLRDMAQMVALVTTVLMFLSPIFYPITAVPEKYRWWLQLNPLTRLIELWRDIIYWGKIPTLENLFIIWFASLFIAWLGYIWFQKTRAGFADVL